MREERTDNPLVEDFQLIRRQAFGVKERMLKKVKKQFKSAEKWSVSEKGEFSGKNKGAYSKARKKRRGI